MVTDAVPPPSSIAFTLFEPVKRVSITARRRPPD
jgi:hypothetical protein